MGQCPLCLTREAEPTLCAACWSGTQELVKEAHVELKAMRIMCDEARRRSIELCADQVNAAYAELTRLQDALRRILALSSDRQRFVMMGPRGFAEAERVASEALAALPASPGAGVAPVAAAEVLRFAQLILHGDEKHRAWLSAAAEQYVKDRTVLVPDQAPEKA